MVLNIVTKIMLSKGIGNEKGFFFATSFLHNSCDFSSIIARDDSSCFY